MSDVVPDHAVLRLGIDLGGSKIAGVALGADGAALAQHREPAPRLDYAATVRAIGEMVAALEQEAGSRGTIGIGMPGSISPASGLVQNANSTWLNGRPFAADLEAHLGRAVRLANDANCFALSEAIDGAGAGAVSVFGVILGTGCGGGLVYRGALIDGPHHIGGEWGHNPLPWASRMSILGACAGAAATAAWKHGCRGRDWRPTTHARAARRLQARRLSSGPMPATLRREPASIAMRVGLPEVLRT